MKRFLIQASAAALMLLLSVSTAAASEADLVLPDLGSVSFLGGVSGRALLMVGLVISFVGVAFGLVMFVKLRNLPVHRSMRDISELIYETCKTYLITQGKFILLLELFIGAVMVIYFGWLKRNAGRSRRDNRGIQLGWHRGQLWRGVVRHPH